MPPRYVYWTILIDNKPTAFRARDKEDLLPTLAQLRRTNANVEMKWFARGRIWDSPEEERAAQERPRPPAEKRGRDWRPGGHHKDPRDRFRKPKDGEHDRSWAGKSDRPRSDRPQGERPWRPKKPFGAPGGGDSPRRSPQGGGGPRWQKPGSGHGGQGWKPRGEDSQNKPWQKKPGGPPRGDRPWHPKGPGEGRPWDAKRSGGQGGQGWKPRGDRPRWQKPGSGHGGPGWKPRGEDSQNKPWQNKAGGPPRREGPPRRGPQGGGGRGQWPPRNKKKRDDEDK